MSYPHWEYFLSIEADLASCARYVEFHDDNFSTYSVEFARVIIASGAEFDVVAKRLCARIDPAAKKPERINEYYSIITAKYPKFVDHVVHIPRFKMELKPWQSWTLDSAPHWWSRGYNKIKHERDTHFREANLENAIYSTAGLLLGIIYLYDALYDKVPKIEMSAAPKLLDPLDYPGTRPRPSSWWTARAWK